MPKTKPKTEDIKKREYEREVEAAWAARKSRLVRKGRMSAITFAKLSRSARGRAALKNMDRVLGKSN